MACELLSKEDEKYIKGGTIDIGNKYRIREAMTAAEAGEIETAPYLD